MSLILVVAIPALNAETTIAEQLAAVLAQKCSVPFDVVVADNGSRDATAAVVQSFAGEDNRVHLVDASRARGEAFARNAAVNSCESEFVAFCDADDEVRPGWLAAVYDALSSGAHAVNVTREQWSLNPGARDIGAPEFANSAWVAGGAFAIRRDLYLELGGFATDMPTAADTEFGFRLFDRVGRHPRRLTDAVVSVRLPMTAGAVFTRARALSRTRGILRQRHPRHVSPTAGDVLRTRAMLLGMLVKQAHQLASSRRLAWLEVLGTLVGDVEGGPSRPMTGAASPDRLDSTGCEPTSGGPA